MRVYALFVGALLACESGAPPLRAPAATAAPDSAVVEEVVIAESIDAGVGSSLPPTDRDLEPQPQATASWLARYDFDDRLWHVDMPGRLDEISGLAFDGDGRLFAHDDEVGRVHELDPRTGEVLGSFRLGPSALRDDFEGIAIAGDRHFLVSSIGLLYEFRAGMDGERVDFRTTDTGVGAGCEVEGLDVLDDGELLLACKAVSPERGRVVLHRLSLSGAPPSEPIQFDRETLRPTEVDRDFAPSAVAVTPTGSIAILSGRHEAVVEIDRQGRILFTVELRNGRHPQSEGIAFGPDGTLYIADEKNGQDARLTAYRPRDDGSER